MIIVHHLAHSRSQRVLWLLEELGVPYEVKRYEWWIPGTPSAPPELKKIHPLGKSPVIVGDGRTIAETGAIFDYLLEQYGHGRLIPAGAEDRLACRYWLHYAEGSLMPPLVTRRILRTVPGYAPRWIRPLVRRAVNHVDVQDVGQRITTQLRFCNDALAATGWFAGDALSAADIMMSLPLELARARADISGYPHIQPFIARVQALPAYRQAVARGGEYMHAA